MKYIAAILTYFLIGCSSISNNSQEKHMTIDNSDIKEDSDISSLVREVQIIKLNEKKGNLLGNVFKLLVVKDGFIVFDRFKAKKVSYFSKNGNFIKDILTTGLGPNQALQINDCWSDDNNFYAYDFAQKKIYCYDSQYNLKNILQDPNRNIYTSISNIPKSDDFVAYANYNDQVINKGNRVSENIVFLNSKFNIIGTELPFNKELADIDWVSYPQHFFKYGDSLRFIKAYDKNIYTITKNSSAVNRFTLKFMEDTKDEAMLESDIVNNLNVLQNRELSPDKQHAFLKNYITLRGAWLEKQDLVFFMYSDKSGANVVSMYDKKTSASTINSKLISVKKNYDMILPYFIATDEDSNSNNFYGIINGFEAEHYFRNHDQFLKFNFDTNSLYIVKILF